MKKLWIAGVFMVMTLHVSAQTGYETAMNGKIAKIESHLSQDEFTALSNDFKRIGEKEKNSGFHITTQLLRKSKKGECLCVKTKYQT